ncbi:MAG TPA: adenosylcobinamide-GDP ribazoletransferase [Polyangiaceae bacterium]|nr:adenosylcobinamide-GDP ribazoletransferase [Polyangiaceae bacterium]
MTAPSLPTYGLPPYLRGLRAAFVFLTRLPVGGFPYQRRDFEWAAAHFPNVGFIVGAAGGLVHYLSRGLGDMAAALFALGTTAWLTGAFHEDGLADTFDALGGYHNRERIFEILKDSRIGSYGSVALFVVLGLRVALLTNIAAKASSPYIAAAAVIAAQVFGRVPAVWLLAITPYVSPEAQAKGSGVAGAGFPQALVATAFAALYLGGLGPLLEPPLLFYPALFAALAVTGLVLRRWFLARVGGVTGDLLGATEQLSEVAVLVAWSWAFGGMAAP